MGKAKLVLCVAFRLAFSKLGWARRWSLGTKTIFPGAGGLEKGDRDLSPGWKLKVLDWNLLLVTVKLSANCASCLRLFQ